MRQFAEAGRAGLEPTGCGWTLRRGRRGLGGGGVALRTGHEDLFDYHVPAEENNGRTRVRNRDRAEAIDGLVGLDDVVVDDVLRGLQHRDVRFVVPVAGLDRDGHRPLLAGGHTDVQVHFGGDDCVVAAGNRLGGNRELLTHGAISTVRDERDCAGQDVVLFRKSQFEPHLVTTALGDVVEAREVHVTRLLATLVEAGGHHAVADLVTAVWLVVPERGFDDDAVLVGRTVGCCLLARGNGGCRGGTAEDDDAVGQSHQRRSERAEAVHGWGTPWLGMLFWVFV